MTTKKRLWFLISILLPFGLVPAIALAFGVRSGVAILNGVTTITHGTQTCINVAGGTAELCVTDGEVTVTALQEQTTSGIPIQRTDGTQVGFVGEQGAGGLEVQSSTTTITIGRSGQTAMLVCNGSACTLQNPLSIQNATGFQIGAGGSFVKEYRHGTTVIDIASTASLACTSATLSAIGTAAAGDACTVNRTTNSDVVGSIKCNVVAGGVQMEYCNETASARDPASTTYVWTWTDRT